MLNESAVSGLVVSRMEAILEHDGFDVVVFIERNCINLSFNLYSVHLLFGEIPICLLAVGIY